MSGIVIENGLTVYLPVDPTADQTPFYQGDGTPLSADDPNAAQVPEVTDPTCVFADVLVVGEPRNRRIGPESAGIQLQQPRRGTILVARDEATQTLRSVAYHPAAHPAPSAEITYEEADTALPITDERRSLRRTAVHEKHTLADWRGNTPPRDPQNRRSTLSRGGWLTNLGEAYQQPAESGDSPAETPGPDDPDAFSDPPWEE